MPDKKRKEYSGGVGAAAGRAVFDPYDAVATGAGAGTVAGRQMAAPGGGVGAMAGRTLAGLDAQRAVADANALAGWYEAMAFPNPNPDDAYLMWGDTFDQTVGPGGGTRMGRDMAAEALMGIDPSIERLRDPRLATPYGRQMIRGMAPSPDYINAQRVLGTNRVMGY